MKKNVLTAMISLITGFTYAQWVQQDVPLGFEGYIYDIETVDANTAWGTPYDNSTGTASATASFVRTSDGGAIWTMGNITGAPTAYLVSNIWPIDAQTCYVAMYNSAGGGGGVYKTTDGGMTWNQSGTSIFLQPNSFPDFVYFHDSQNGIAMGDPINATPYYEIYVTNDAGVTWTQVVAPDVPYASGNTDYGVVNLFTASQGHIWFGTSEGDVYHSSDLGYHWLKVASGFPPYISNGSRYDISDMAFTDSLNGIILQINASSYLVKRTSDGGNTWVDITPTGNFFISDIDAVPGTSALVSAGSSNAGGFGTSFSMDHGISWTPIDSLVSHTSVDFSDNITGYSGEYITAGSPGGVWKYTGAPLAVITQFAETQQTQIYPNPSHGLFNVIGKAESDRTTFEIFDVQGKLVFNKSFESLNVFNEAFNLSSTAPGIYTMKITDGNDISIFKLLLQ